MLTLNNPNNLTDDRDGGPGGRFEGRGSYRGGRFGGRGQRDGRGRTMNIEQHGRGRGGRHNSYYENQKQQNPHQPDHPRGGNGGRFYEGRGRGFFRGRGRGFRGGGGRGDMNARGPPRDQSYYGNQTRNPGAGPGRGRGHGPGGRFTDMNSMGQSMESSPSSFKDEPSLPMEAPTAVNTTRHSSGPTNTDHSDSFKRSLPTYGSMSENVDDGNNMSGGQGPNPNLKRMRYESLGSTPSGGNHSHVQLENPIPGISNIESIPHEKDDRGDRLQSFQRAPSMERHTSDSGSMGGAPSPRSGPIGGGRGSSISPRRSFSHPGRNGFGRGRGRADFSHSHQPHSYQPHPHPSVDRSISGSSDFETEKDQFGRKIQPNAGRGNPNHAGLPSHSQSPSPYGRVGGGGRHFNTGRGGGRYGRGGRYNNTEFPGCHGGRGRMGGRGYNNRASTDHYGSRPEQPLDSYQFRHGSNFHEEGNDSTSRPQVDNQSTPSSGGTQQYSSYSSKRSSTPPPKDRKEVVDVIPPSPPAAPPSALALAMARLADLNETMEFQYARHQQLTREHECIKVKIETLKELPVGMDAFKEDLDKFVKEMRCQQSESA